MHSILSCPACITPLHKMPDSFFPFGKGSEVQAPAEGHRGTGSEDTNVQVLAGMGEACSSFPVPDLTSVATASFLKPSLSLGSVT